MSNDLRATTSVGRLVGGSLYKPSTTDADGNPLVVKNGPNKGQPRVDYYFELAIQKGAEPHWAHTSWGAIIWQMASTAFPQACQAPTFAFKVTDGDSQVPNTKGKTPASREGYPGHWVVRFSSGFAPKIYRIRAGTTDQFDSFNDPDAIKLGSYAQVQFTVKSNESQSKPGVILNHNMVCFSGYGKEIVVGPDVTSAGFGGVPLPAGASAVPLGVAAMPAGLPGSLPVAAGAPMPPPGMPAAAPLLPGFPAPGGAPALPGAYIPPAGVPVPGPAAGFAPAAAAMVPPPMAVAPPAAAGGLVQVPGAAYTIEQCRAGGWTDDVIVAQGVATRAPAALPAPLPQATFAPAPGVPGAPIAPAGVVPNPGFAQIPPAAPGAAAAPQLTAAGAALGTYEGFIAQGWQPADMRARGYLV